MLKISFGLHLVLLSAVLSLASCSETSYVGTYTINCNNAYGWQSETQIRKVVCRDSALSVIGAARVVCKQNEMQLSLFDSNNSTRDSYSFFSSNNYILLSFPFYESAKLTTTRSQKYTGVTFTHNTGSFFAHSESLRLHRIC